jgi:hypothetical protein
MKMVRHEAVRNYFNVAAACSTQKLSAHALTSRKVREVFLALERAHREENTVRTDVAIIRKARRTTVRHKGPPSKFRSHARLKPSRYIRRAISSADLSVRATKVNVPFVHPPVGIVGAPTTNRLS